MLYDLPYVVDKYTRTAAYSHPRTHSLRPSTHKTTRSSSHLPTYPFIKPIINPSTFPFLSIHLSFHTHTSNHPYFSTFPATPPTFFSFIPLPFQQPPNFSLFIHLYVSNNPSNLIFVYSLPYFSINPSIHPSTFPRTHSSFHRPLIYFSKISPIFWQLIHPSIHFFKNSLIFPPSNLPPTFPKPIRISTVHPSNFPENHPSFHRLCIYPLFRKLVDIFTVHSSIHPSTYPPSHLFASTYATTNEVFVN